jgi:hypothetical protein
LPDIKGANGSSGTPAASDTSNGAGDATHQLSISASGPPGSIDSLESATKTARGVDQSRTSAATAANSDTYNGSIWYTPQTGLTHSGTSSDASVIGRAASLLVRPGRWHPQLQPACDRAV